MGAKSFPVTIANPETLKWARESSGKSVADVANKLGVAPSVVTRWEAGEDCPTLAQLQKLTIQYKRCLAALLLPQPPQESPPPTEYRTLPERRRHPLGEEVFLAIRRARGVQSSFKELVGSLGGAAAGLPTADLRDDPEELAARVAAYLELANPDAGTYRALGQRIAAVEAVGILVLQLGMPVEQSRAFSLSDDTVHVIVVNSHDGPNPRSFSLFHELGHLLLRRTGTCGKMRGFSRSGSGEQVTEAFCNQFAASLLVPRVEFLHSEPVQSHGSSPEWSDAELSHLASRFVVSRQVVLRRLLTLRLTTHSFFQHKQAALEQQAAQLKKRGGGRADPAGRAIRENGQRFAGLVMDAYRQELVGPTDAAALLGVKYKHFSSIEAMLASARR